jgi:hypothetical protein
VRRTSIVAPLLLIAIGGLFLARNLYPELPLLDYLARYWPFLLIVWGVLRLAEVLFWVATDKPIPARGISGGEWVLVIFLCLMGGAVHAVRGVSDWWPRNGVIAGLDVFGESYDYPISGEKATSKTPHVVIEAFRGNAKITGADVDAVKVGGTRSIKSLDQNGADNANKDAPFELAGDTNEVIVRTNQDRLNGGRVRLSAEMEITVPKGATIEAHGRLGDFDITNVSGNVVIDSDNAGVRLENIGGDVRIDLRKSDIVRAVNVKGLVDIKGHGSDIDLQNIEGQVTVTGAYSGEIQFRNLSKPLRFNGERTDIGIEKLPGELKMGLGDLTASNLIGPVHISGRARDVTISDFTNSLEVMIDRGDITLRPGSLPLAKIDAEARVSGDVTLALPPAAKFDLTGTTARGDVTNDFGAPIRTQSSGRGQELRGSLAGGPTVSLHTERGTVTVRKASPDDKPVAARSEASETPASTKPLKKIDQ